MIILEGKDVSYTKNLQHLGCIALAMVSVFAENAKLSADFAEAVAFYITRSIISIVPMLRIMNDNKKITEHFEEIDSAIRFCAPENWEVIRKNNISSIQFAMRYEVLLFARENHNAVEILNMWDQIIARLAQLEFIKCLSVAHIMQIKLAPNSPNPLEEIRNWKNWNVLQIIKDATIILKHQRSCQESFCQYFCPKLTQFAGYEIKPQFLF